MSDAQDDRRTIDEVALIRGASTGFTVLLVGELLAPVAGRVDPTLGLLWVSLVGAAGFVAAGTRIGQARVPWLHGGAAALLALSLTMPLRLVAGLDTGADWYRVGVSAVFGMVVGSLAGRAAGLARDRTARS